MEESEKSSKMVEISFLAEVKFRGSTKEFEKSLNTLEKMNMNLTSPGGDVMIETVPMPDLPFPGMYPVIDYLGPELVHKVSEGMPRFKLIKDIYGGIRNPHLHIDGDVVLLDREKFKEVVDKVAHELTEDLADRGDYFKMVGAIHNMKP